MTGYQIGVLAAFGIFACWILLPGIIGKDTALGAFLAGNSVLAPLVALFLVGFVHLHGKPVADISETASVYPWRIFLLIAVAMLLGDAMTGKGTNVTVFMEYLLRGVLEGFGYVPLCIVVVLLAIIFTNFCNSVVLGLVLTPVLLAMCNAFGMNAGPLMAHGLLHLRRAHRGLHARGLALCRHALRQQRLALAPADRRVQRFGLRHHCRRGHRGGYSPCHAAVLNAAAGNPPAARKKRRPGKSVRPYGQRQREQDILAGKKSAEWAAACSLSRPPPAFPCLFPLFPALSCSLRSAFLHKRRKIQGPAVRKKTSRENLPGRKMGLFSPFREKILTSLV